VFETVLFDLDGTLVDTAGDLGSALNTVRGQRGLPPLADERTRAQASHGSQGLIRLGFGIGGDHPDFPALRQEFLAAYEANLTARSTLFPGMANVLDALEGKQIKWGVVTNKPARYTEPLMAHLGLLERAACVVSGDTCPHPKPHPAPMRHACRVVHSDPADCLYVGDAARDMAAATAVGMRGLVALYGYLGEDDRPEEWGAAGYIDTPAGLLDWIEDGIHIFSGSSPRT
jgi:2-phosphoglycolate phosphatase